MNRCRFSTCTASVREDTEFTRDALAYNLPVRRYVCHRGHSTHVDVVPLEKSIPEPNTRLTRHEKPVRKKCKWCRDWFEGTRPFLYCSLECAESMKNATRYARRRGHKQINALSRIRYGGGH